MTIAAPATHEAAWAAGGGRRDETSVNSVLIVSELQARNCNTILCTRTAVSSH